MAEEKATNRRYLKPAAFLTAAVAVIVVAVLFTRFYFSRGRIRNVVLISIDTCRADHLSCYGYPRRITPNIDSVAAEGVLFTHVVTPAPLTLPAHCSMLTGTIPPHHGAHDNLGYVLDDESNITLAEVLRERGYMTGAIVSSFVLDSQFGLAQGFETYNDEFVEPLESFYQNERRGGEASEFACKWLAEHGSKPFFLFLHYYDPHQAYRPPEPFATSYRDNLYAGEIAYVDYCIGQVIDKLKELGLYDETLLIITADHGESLGEHSETTHGYFIYQSTVRVPLIIRAPAGPKGEQVDDMVGIVDIFPTVCSTLGVAGHCDVDGIDLGWFLEPVDSAGSDSSAARVAYCESPTPATYGCTPLFGVVSGNWKYIHCPEPELYDLGSDWSESRNLIGEESKRAFLLRQQLETILQERGRSDLASSRTALGGEALRRLESLGYIAAGDVFDQFELDVTGAEPKEFIGLHDRVTRFNGYVRADMVSQAESVCEEIIQEFPNCVLNDFLQGKIAAVKDDDEATIVHLTNFLLRVEDGEGVGEGDADGKRYDRNFIGRCIKGSHSELGKAYYRLGKYAEAAAHCERAVEMGESTSEVYFNLGSAYWNLDRLDDAMDSYVRALELDPELAAAHFHLGNALLSKGRFDEAISHYEEVLRLEPGQPLCENNLRAAMNLKRCTALLERDANQPEMHANMAVVYHQLGNIERAVYHWGKALELGLDTADVCNNLAWVRATCEDERFFDAQEAVRLAEKACELSDYNNPGYLDTLGVTYSSVGRYSDAIEAAERAIDLTKTQGGEQLAAEIAKHLDCYRQGRAYRE